MTGEHRTARGTGASTRVLGTSPDDMAAAARLLRAGRLVAFPTETVYGIGADATDAAAIASLYAAKGRPRFNPLIAHVLDIDAARRIGLLDATALMLAERFWPGPLTLVVEARPDTVVSDLARAGLPSVAIRVPSHPLARALLAQAGRPVAAPSANRSGHVSATTAAHVLADLDGLVDAVVNGGPAQLGVESSIVGLLGERPVLLRPGAITCEQLDSALGFAVSGPAARKNDRPDAPGQLASHYAPWAAVRLDAVEVHPGEALLAFGPDLPAGAAHATAVRNLSPAGDLREAAATLFSALRELDAARPRTVAVMPIPAEGIGLAIRDRLARAAAPRR